MKPFRFGVLSVCMLAVAALPVLAQLQLNPTPARSVGQPSSTAYTNSPNLVEGRELASPSSVAVDMSAGFAGPVYVADTGNNRVLGWASAAALKNGSAADIVIGQSNRYATAASGPAAGFSSGLYWPSSVAVDATGDLYVADSGNHRILRYPRPFDQKVDVRLPNMVLGQSSVSGNTANAGGLSAKSLSSISVVRISTDVNLKAYVLCAMAFDSLDAQGKPGASASLWVADPGNNRVLRFSADVLRAGANAPAADLVLGQTDFVSNGFGPKGVTDPNAAWRPASKIGLAAPGSLAFDQAGRLFICDYYNRVVVFSPPFTTGKTASRLIGVSPGPAASHDTQPRTASAFSLGLYSEDGGGSYFNPPQAVFLVGNTPYVMDSPLHRVLRYDPVDIWPLESEAISPTAKAALGQDGFTETKPNRGKAEPDANTFRFPGGGCVAGGDVYLADTGNNRVLIFRSNSVDTAYKVLGQDDFNFNAVNLIEGREFNFGGAGVSPVGAGMAVDTRSDTPALFVADTYNNRVLGFRDVRQLKPGSKADIVIGQANSTDFRRALINFPKNDPAVRSDAGLYGPTGVAIDPKGDLWVADTGNGRVLRYPKPFQQGGQIKPNLVLGQASFTTLINDATASTMAAPVGLAFTSTGNLLVSDTAHHRVLYFERPSGGDFFNGQSAAKVFGRDDFSSTPAAVPANRMNNPRGIAVDVDDRLYVADTANNRVLIYDRIPATFGISAPPAYTLTGVNAPYAVAVGPESAEIWVADSYNNRVVRYPSYVSLIFNQTIQDTVPSQGPIGLTVDGFGNVIVAEAVNRVAMFYPKLVGKNAASYNDQRGFAPGMIASLFAPNEKNCAEMAGYRPRFTDGLFVFDSTVKPFKLPVALGDTAVTINETPVPMYFVAPCQINIQLPTTVPANNVWNIEISRPSTGQILANLTMPYEPASPAFFTNNSAGTGQIAAYNQDGTRNGDSARAPYNTYVSLYGTGQGFIDGAPPAGEPAPTDRIVKTAETPTAYVGTQQTDVQFSGLAPGLVGVWQVNVKVPDRTDPTKAVPVIVILSSRPNNVGPGGARIETTIWAKQP